MRPDVLTLLASTHYQLDELDETAQTLRLAYELAPFDPEVAVLRAWLAINIWDRLGATGQAAAARDFRTLVRREPEEFAYMIVDTSFEPIVREALASTPNLLDQLDQELVALRFAIADEEEV